MFNYNSLKKYYYVSFWPLLHQPLNGVRRIFAYFVYIVKFYNIISNVPCTMWALIGIVDALRQCFGKGFNVPSHIEYDNCLGEHAFPCNLTTCASLLALKAYVTIYVPLVVFSSVIKNILLS